MLRVIILFVFISLVRTHPLKDLFARQRIAFYKTLGRSQRSETGSIPEHSCDSQAPNNSVIWHVASEDQAFPCPCLTFQHDNTGSLLVKWFYEDDFCKEIEELDDSPDVSMKFLEEHFNTSGTPLVVWCQTLTDTQMCISKITVDNSEIIEKGVPSGVAKFLVFLLILGLLISLLCVANRFKVDIHLCVRDSCGNSNDDDKVYDAYISIAGGGTERKYIERSFTNKLQSSHNYRFFIDEESILEQLEYSSRLNDMIHLCNRFILVLTPEYMNNDWCMYCFVEGFRKLLALKIPMLVVMSDNIVREEVRQANNIINNAATMMVPFVQTDEEKSRNMLKIRQFLAAPIGRGSGHSCDSRQPILKHVQDIDRRSTQDIMLETSETTITDNRQKHHQQVAQEAQELDFEYDDEMADPNEVQIKEYKTQKNFYSLTGEAGSL